MWCHDRYRLVAVRHDILCPDDVRCVQIVDALTLVFWKAYAVAVESERSRLDRCVQKANALLLLVQKVYTLTLLVRKAYAVAAASECSYLDSCIQKVNALTLLVWKAYAVVAASKRSRLTSCIQTHGTIANCVCTQSAMTSGV